MGKKKDHKETLHAEEEFLELLAGESDTKGDDS